MMMYLTVSCDTNPKTLDMEVTDLLAVGWKLYGNPFASNGWLYQAMTKED